MEYRSGTCRNEQEKRCSHTYMEDEDGNLYPMCGYGWNRSDGYGISIFRGPYGSEGTCKRCQKNLRDGKPPLREPWPHPTKWL
jgi:hypothetical protein